MIAFQENAGNLMSDFVYLMAPTISNSNYWRLDWKNDKKKSPKALKMVAKH